MPEIARINMDKARFEPEAEFGSPDKLVASVAMTRGQKIASLQRWAMRLRDRVKSDPRVQAMPSEEVALLQEIERAMAVLKAV